MLESSKMKTKLLIKPSICIFGTLALLWIPWKWLSAWIFAIAVHELSHYLILRLSGHWVSELRIGIGGAEMETDGLSPTMEILCAVAGPAASLLLTFLPSLFPRIAVCGLFHFLYNLLPIYPLDGGRAFRGMMCFLIPERAKVAGKVAENVVIILMLLGAIYGALRLSMGLLPILLIGILILKIKIPCKQKRLRVQ